MEEKKIENTIDTKSHILLPVIFLLTLIIAILFLASDSFMEGLSPIMVWFFFAVCLIYISIALFDCYKNTTKTQKQKSFIIIMSILSTISTILFIVFYLIAK